MAEAILSLQKWTEEVEAVLSWQNVTEAISRLQKGTEDIKAYFEVVEGSKRR